MALPAPPSSPDAAPDPTPPRPHRSLGKWTILLAVWVTGLISWALYVAAAVYLLTRIP